MKRISVFVLILSVIFPLVLTSCFRKEAPSYDDVEKLFKENYQDIQTVTSYLTENECLYISISNDDGTVLMDGYEVELHNKSVLEAVERLMNNNNYIEITKYYNTINFMQWTSINASCGIACSIDKAYNPQTDYNIEMIPLSEKGWFYYKDDYTQWSEKAAENENKQEDKTLC